MPVKLGKLNPVYDWVKKLKLNLFKKIFSVILTTTFLVSLNLTPAQADSVVGDIPVGTYPIQLTINSNNSVAYVSNYTSSNISVIDLTTNQVTNTISVGDNPWGIALSPDESKAYVVVSGEGKVKVIDLSTSTITSDISVGSQPIDIVLTPDGTFAYVTNFGSSTVSKINLVTNAVTNTISVGSSPRGLAINPTGTKVYTANGEGGFVSEINLTDNTVTNIATANSRGILDIVIDPDGTKAYATEAGFANVQILDLTTKTFSSRIPLSVIGDLIWGLAIEPTGKYLYVYALSGSIEKIDTDTNSVVASIAVTADARYLTINNAGTYAYLPNFGGANTVTILKLDSINDNSSFPWVGAQSISCPAPNPWVEEQLGFASNVKPVLVSAENTVGKTTTQGSYDSLKTSGVLFDTVSTKVSTATETLPIYGCKDKLLSGKVNQPIQFIAGGYTLQSDAHGYINTSDLKWHDTNGVTLYTNTAAFMHTVKFTKTGKYVVVLTEQPDTSRGLIPTYGVRSIRFVININ